MKSAKVHQFDADTGHGNGNTLAAVVVGDIVSYWGWVEGNPTAQEITGEIAAIQYAPGGTLVTVGEDTINASRCWVEMPVPPNPTNQPPKE